MISSQWLILKVIYTVATHVESERTNQWGFWPAGEA